MNSPDRSAPKTTTVRIFGADYPVRSHADPEYVIEIAKTVDEAMRGVSRNKVIKSTGDIAVMAAMNLAGDLFRTRKQLRAALQQIGDTTDALGRVLDEVAPAVRQAPHAG